MPKCHLPAPVLIRGKPLPVKPSVDGPIAAHLMDVFEAGAIARWRGEPVWNCPEHEHERCRAWQLGYHAHVREERRNDLQG